MRTKETRPQDSHAAPDGKPQLRYVEVTEIISEYEESHDEQAVMVKSLWWDGDSYEIYGVAFRVGDYEEMIAQFAVTDRLWIIWRTDSQRWEPFVAGSGINAYPIVLLEAVDAITGDAAAPTPASGTSPIYVGDYGAEKSYDVGTTVPWEWYGGDVSVNSGKGRMAYVIGGLLIPLCQELDI